MAEGEGTHWHNSSKESSVSVVLLCRTGSQAKPLCHMEYLTAPALLKHLCFTCLQVVTRQLLKWERKKEE